jgi:hypothetical protein
MNGKIGYVPKRRFLKLPSYESFNDNGTVFHPNMSPIIIVSVHSLSMQMSHVDSIELLSFTHDRRAKFMPRSKNQFFQYF